MYVNRGVHTNLYALVLAALLLKMLIDASLENLDSLEFLCFLKRNPSRNRSCHCRWKPFGLFFFFLRNKTNVLKAVS